MSYYIGIDIGTSSVKAMLINENEIQNTISKDYPIYLSNGNYAEQNPEDWYRQSMLAMKELLRDVDKSEVKAIGFCGQMHGLFCWTKRTRLFALPYFGTTAEVKKRSIT